MKDKDFDEVMEEASEITDAIAKILINGKGYRVVSITAALSWWLAQVSIQAGRSKEDTVKDVVGYYDDLNGINMSSGEIQ
jgi:hypothetical protein